MRARMVVIEIELCSEYTAITVLLLGVHSQSSGAMVRRSLVSSPNAEESTARSGLKTQGHREHGNVWIVLARGAALT
jgi:hypothetical protein